MAISFILLSLFLSICFSAPPPIPLASSVNWTTLDADSLSKVYLAVFVSINATQFASINASAFTGFSGNQIENIPPVAFSNLSAEQISYLEGSSSIAGRGCSGLTLEQLSFIPLSSFSGFQANCVQEWGLIIASGITPDQLQQITPAAWEGLGDYFIDALSPACCAVISAAQLAGIRATDNCGSLDEECIPHISPQAFSGFGGVCFAKLMSPTYSYITAAQWSYVNASSFAYLYTVDMQNTNDSIFAGFNLTQLRYLGTKGNAPVGVSPSKISLVVQKYGEQFVSLWDNDQWDDYDRDDMYSFRTNYSSSLGTFNISVSAANATWLQLNLATLGSINFTTLSSLNDKTLGGLRKDHLPQIDPISFANLTYDQANYFPAELLKELPISTLQLIPPSPFSALPRQAFNLMGSQWQNVLPSQISRFSCEVIMAFTPEQMVNFTHFQMDDYLSTQYYCQNPTPPPTNSPSPSPSDTPTNTPTNNPTNTPTSTPTPTPSTSTTGTTTGERIKYKTPVGAGIGLFVAGAVLGSVVIAVVGYLYIRKNRNYQPIA